MIDAYGNKFLPVDELIDILKTLPPGSRAMINEIRNLAILSEDESDPHIIAAINFNYGELEWLGGVVTLGSIG